MINMNLLHFLRRNQNQKRKKFRVMKIRILTRIWKKSFKIFRMLVRPKLLLLKMSSSYKTSMTIETINHKKLEIKLLMMMKKKINKMNMIKGIQDKQSFSLHLILLKHSQRIPRNSSKTLTLQPLNQMKKTLNNMIYCLFHKVDAVQSSKLKTLSLYLNLSHKHLYCYNNPI